MSPRFALSLVLGMATLPVLASAQPFTLKSPAFSTGKLTKEQEYQGFGCTGANKAPALSWQGAPKGTQSFAVTLYDPDAPTGSGWWHWLVVNIPATQSALPAAEKLAAPALQTRTDYGTPGFGGACPPVGDKPHHYRLTLWALKVPKIDVTPESSGALVGYMLNANALASTTLVATYQR